MDGPLNIVCTHIDGGLPLRCGPSQCELTTEAAHFLAEGLRESGAYGQTLAEVNMGTDSRDEIVWQRRALLDCGCAEIIRQEGD